MGSEFIRKKAALKTEMILKLKIFRVLFYIHVEELHSVWFFDVRENSKGNYMWVLCS